MKRYAGFSFLALAIVLLARVLGPCDLWDQTQPRTVSYTTDMIANGRWWLPVSHGEFPATKPPLYNWLAVPAVRALGFASELAHKLPSVLALMASWLLLVRFGRAIGEEDAGADALGWLAGLAFVSNYTIFKLGYLARPDMLLALWTLIGWMASTTVFAGARRGESVRRLPALVFWCATGLAGLTKGPAAVLLVLYAAAAARVVGGRWGAVHLLRWWWGLPLAVGLAGAWYVGVWRIDPEHLREQLWFNEVYGRVTGTGPEGAGGGPVSILRGLPVMPLYYITRFLPWSLLSLLAIGAIWIRWREQAVRGVELPGDNGKPCSVFGVPPPEPPSRLDATLRGAALFLVITIALFSLSAGKRADYAAPALAPGAFLAAWWMLASPSLRRLPWLAPTFAAAVLAMLTVRNTLAPEAPSRDFGDAITAFGRDAGAVIRADPRPVFFHNTGRTHMQPMLGFSQVEGSAEDLALFIDRREPLWIVAGGYPDGPNAFASWAPRWYPSYEFTPVVASEILPEANGWLIQATLFRAEPRAEDAGGGGSGGRGFGRR